MARSWWQPAPCRPFTGCSAPSRALRPSRRNWTRRSSRWDETPRHFHHAETTVWKLTANCRPRRFTTTCRVRTTCSLCWRGSPSWRRDIFIWQGNRIVISHLRGGFVWQISQASASLSSLQSSLGLGHLPRFFSAAMSCLLSPHTQVVAAAASTLKVGTASPGWVTGFSYTFKSF